MADKMINQLNEGELADEQDLFIFQSSTDDETYKIPWGSIIQYLFDNHITEGNNITLTKSDGILTISSSGGDKWYFGSTAPVDPQLDEYWCHTDNARYGDIQQYNGTTWVDKGSFAGRDGITPHIDATTKHWMIDQTDTGIVAEGQTGANGASISATETPITNGHRVTISSTDPEITDVTFDLTNGANGINGVNGTDGASISATQTPIVGGHTVTISSTDPDVSDVTFNVMDGNAGGYSGVNGITVAGNDISVNIGDGLQVNSNTGNIDVIGKQSTITISALLTLAANGWIGNQQTVTFAHDTTKRNVIDITPSEVPAWGAAGVYASAETSAGITFTCATVPETALTFKVTSMEVS